MALKSELTDYNSFLYFAKTADDPFIMWIFGMNGSLLVLYWVVGAIYMAMDTYNWPALQKYKTQPGKNEPVDWIKLRKVCNCHIILCYIYCYYMNYHFQHSR